MTKVQTTNTSLTPQPMSGPNVSFVRLELTELKHEYDLISDCIAGSKRIKKHALAKGYLPQPNAEDASPENKARYESYLKRAVYYNVTKRTVSGMIGQIFLRDPVVNVPPIMDVLKTDASGSGITLDQIAFMLASKDLSYGRVGLLVDYPDTDVPATAADLQAGKIRPSMLVYDSWSIINWRTMVLNGKEVLSLVVIQESIVDEDDGFEHKMKTQWRVLSLANKVPNTSTGTDELGSMPGDGTLYYTVELYEQSETGFTITTTYYPKDGKGARLTEIPFTFVGVFNNDANPDDPPIYDLAELNIAHFRNSADYEESCFIVGQPTPALSGLTEDWVKNILKGRVEFGSRAAIMLPVGAKAELIQAEANTMPREAMQDKERQMVALGAKLVEQKSVQRTLGEAEMENTAEISILANIAKNCELAIVFALTWCARFVNADETEIKYELNSEFDLTQLDPAERAEVIKEWQAGAITFSEMRQNLRRGGVATLDDDAAKKALIQDKTDGVGPPVPPPANDPNATNKQPPMNKDTVAPAPAA